MRAAFQLHATDPWRDDIDRCANFLRGGEDRFNRRRRTHPSPICRARCEVRIHIDQIGEHAFANVRQRDLRQFKDECGAQMRLFRLAL
ncbi:hypothetical protein SS37A_12470 [Methylocystis iwaonis]|uniref:Uncharacterized protein n=1 Tax=Methylocystis iwaonis TaxID=2885079 RepID=A0ABM8E710_9HYPH|nr:hypothetical protein SS37A_12470 [Methylocystis iwaonis]